MDAAIAQAAPQVSLLAAEITSGRCEPVHSLNAEETTPIGSGFKLYILGEIASQIAGRGRGGYHDHHGWGKRHHHERSGWSRGHWRNPIDWDTPVALEARYKSVPHGPLLFVPDGSKFTLRYLAEQMIQRSDNTATDHLLFLAGRRNVERRMRRMGHHDPSLNIPLPATREFAVIKFLWSDDELAAYENASVRDKRALLAAEQRGFPELDAFFEANGDQTEPVRLERVEWFANRLDMCNALLSLHEMGQDKRLRPLLEVLTLEDQIGIDREDWTYVGFKGGSELGLLAGNWLLQRNDGRLFVFTVALVNPAAALDLGIVVPLLQSAVEILYETP